MVRKIDPNHDGEESVKMDMILELLEKSTCNVMAVDNIEEVLWDNGFEQLLESERWKIKPGGKYYLTKNNTAIFAFIAGTKPVSEAGIRIISAHTDSPCFKLKPNCEIYGDGGVVSLNVEKYGGGILYTWFDRPLSIAGKVMLKGVDPFHPDEIHIDVERAIATIPHLAIHFNRSVNEGNPLSVQKDMKPVVGYYSPEEIERFKKSGGVIRAILAEEINDFQDRNIRPEDIIDYELCLYPLETAEYLGANDEYFQSGRIDDLSMAFCGLIALIDQSDEPSEQTRILALFDNEETGSGTKQGAASPVLRSIVERICISTCPDNPEAIYQALAHSFMISADDAHAWHPNYNEKYDPTNHPVLGGGPVVKINANSKYMTDAKGAAVFHALCDEAGVNMQYFVNHADVAGGSTLGNISTSQLDIDGVDVGCAIWAMHSARETAAVSDHLDMIKVMRQFFI